MSMSQVIESIEREAFERATKPTEEMSLVEYAEKICPFTLSNFQKELIAQYEQAIKEDKRLFVASGRICGRDFITRLVREWERQNKLNEYRCPCGRLLGRFSGQAEVKCPKCGKVNVIGVEKHGINR